MASTPSTTMRTFPSQLPPIFPYARALPNFPNLDPSSSTTWVSMVPRPPCLPPESWAVLSSFSPSPPSCGWTVLAVRAVASSVLWAWRPATSLSQASSVPSRTTSLHIPLLAGLPSSSSGFTAPILPTRGAPLLGLYVQYSRRYNVTIRISD